MIVKWIINPVGPECNLACQYCCQDTLYDREKNKTRLQWEDFHRMLDKIRDLSGDHIYFHWHGGEPLLAGKEFYRRVIESEREVLVPQAKVYNAMSTNGLLLDEEWITLLDELRIASAISLDGPGYEHNRYRFRSEAAYQRVMERAKLTKKLDKTLDVTLVVSNLNWDKAKEMAVGFAELGVFQLRLLPCYLPNSELAVTAEQYGTFLCDLFDAWTELQAPFRVAAFNLVWNALKTRRLDTCFLLGRCTTVHAENDGRLYNSCIVTSERTLIGDLFADSVPELKARYAEFERAFGEMVPVDAREVLLGSARPTVNVEGVLCPYFDKAVGEHMYLGAYRRLAAHMLVAAGMKVEDL